MDAADLVAIGGCVILYCAYSSSNMNLCWIGLFVLGLSMLLEIIGLLLKINKKLKRIMENGEI